MLRLNRGLIGIAQGSRILFSDFIDGGAMWTGTGPREDRSKVIFEDTFDFPPVVTVAISMWDIDHSTNSRMDISAEAVTAKGFDIVFRTWGDSRVARIRASWTAIGSLNDPDLWNVD